MSRETTVFRRCSFILAEILKNSFPGVILLFYSKILGMFKEKERRGNFEGTQGEPGVSIIKAN